MRSHWNDNIQVSTDTEIGTDAYMLFLQFKIMAQTSLPVLLIFLVVFIALTLRARLDALSRTQHEVPPMEERTHHLHEHDSLDIWSSLPASVNRDESEHGMPSTTKPMRSRSRSRSQHRRKESFSKGKRDRYEQLRNNRRTDQSTPDVISNGIQADMQGQDTTTTPNSAPSIIPSASSSSPESNDTFPSNTPLQSAYLYFRLAQHAVHVRGRAASYSQDQCTPAFNSSSYPDSADSPYATFPSLSARNSALKQSLKLTPAPAFPLVHGCTPKQLVSLVVDLGWISLRDALTWADARETFGRGLILRAEESARSSQADAAASLESLDENEDKPHDTQDRDSETGENRPSSSAVKEYITHWACTMPPEGDLLYDWCADHAHRAEFGPLGSAVTGAHSRCKVTGPCRNRRECRWERDNASVEHVVEAALKEKPEESSLDEIPDTLRHVLLPLMHAAKYESEEDDQDEDEDGENSSPEAAHSGASNASHTCPPAPSTRTETVAQTEKVEEKKHPHHTSTPSSNLSVANPETPAAQPPSLLSRISSIPTNTTSTATATVAGEPMSTVDCKIQPASTRRPPTPVRKESLEDYAMLDPPEYTLLAPALSSDLQITAITYGDKFEMEMDLDSPRYYQSFFEQQPFALGPFIQQPQVQQQPYIGSNWGGATFNNFDAAMITDDDVEMLFTSPAPPSDAMTGLTMAPSTIEEEPMALSPPPQYAALAPDERVILERNDGVGVGILQMHNTPNAPAHSYPTSSSSNYQQQQQQQGSSIPSCTDDPRIALRRPNYTSGYGYRLPSNVMLSSMRRQQRVVPIATDDASMTPTPELTPATTIATVPSSAPMSAVNSGPIAGPGPSSSTNTRVYQVTEHERGRSQSRNCINEGNEREYVEEEEKEMMGDMMKYMKEIEAELKEKEENDRLRQQLREQEQEVPTEDEREEEEDDDDEEEEEEEEGETEDGEHEEGEVKIKKEEDEGTRETLSSSGRLMSRELDN